MLVYDGCPCCSSYTLARMPSRLGRAEGPASTDGRRKSMELADAAVSSCSAEGAAAAAAAAALSLPPFGAAVLLAGGAAASSWPAVPMGSCAELDCGASLEGSRETSFRSVEAPCSFGVHFE